MFDKIPVAEKQITRCPICQGGFLRVESVNDDDETLCCPICGVKFRNALNSDHLMFLETPLNFPGNIVGLWLTRAEIGKALHEYRMMLNKVGVINQAKQRSIEIQKENPIRARAVRQARELVGQGKSVESVTDVLKNSFTLTDYAIEEIIQDAVAVTKELKKQKKEKITKTSLMVVLLLIIVSALLLAILN